MRLHTLIIGAGHAGLATSHCLNTLGIENLVLERTSIAARWKERWASLRLVTPSSLLALPDHRYEGQAAFLSRDATATFIEQYAKRFSLPVRTGVQVLRVARNGTDGFYVTTSHDTYAVKNVVVATGAYARPFVPRVAERLAPSIHQLHSNHYLSPSQLPSGSVLVVGSGQAGVQIAAELAKAGRSVVLASSPCGWVPRRYRGRDILEWAASIGFFDRKFEDLRSPELSLASSSPQLIGNDAGETINLSVLAALGVTLCGRVLDTDGDRVRVADDLQKTLRFGDEFAKNFLNAIDQWVREKNVTAEAAARQVLPWQGTMHCLALESFRLSDLGISSVVWATGASPDHGVLSGHPVAANGIPIHVAGQSPMPGLFFVGLHFQTHRDSALIQGIERDARIVAQAIAKQTNA